MKNLNTKGLVGLSVIALLGGCGSEKQESVEKVPEKKVKPSKNAPNIILIVSDDHGTDDAGCYGNKAIKTPNIDYLASEGVRFNRAYCTSASSSPSRSVILTGMHSHANGMYGLQHHEHHFDAFNNIKSLPVLLRDLGGYHTARIGKYHLGPEKIFEFDTTLTGVGFNAFAMADTCRKFFETQKDNPFFLYFCTIDPHRRGGIVENDPLKPNRFGNRDEGYPGIQSITFDPDSVAVPPYLPNSPECRAELAQYYQAVARIDQGFGQLFNHLKETELWDNTVIIYLSDNGIAFPGAKTNHYEAGLRLPCIVKYTQSRQKGTVSDALISWTDITPTILDIAGILPQSRDLLKEIAESDKENWDEPFRNKDFQGKSFKQILETGESNPAWDAIFASHSFHEVTMYYPMRTIITKKYKLIWNIAHELPYPHASDLWSSSTWQAALKSEDQMYGNRTVQQYINRPEFELYDIENDAYEAENLANKPEYSDTLQNLKNRLKQFQKQTNDAWVIKWERE